MILLTGYDGVQLFTRTQFYEQFLPDLLAGGDSSSVHNLSQGPCDIHLKEVYDFTPLLFMINTLIAKGQLTKEVKVSSTDTIWSLYRNLDV